MNHIKSHTSPYPRFGLNNIFGNFSPILPKEEVWPGRTQLRSLPDNEMYTCEVLDVGSNGLSLVPAPFFYIFSFTLPQEIFGQVAQIFWALKPSLV